MSNPFAGRHAARRDYRGLWLALLALGIAAAMLAGTYTVAHASTTHQPRTVQFYRGPIGAGPQHRPTVRSLTRAIVRQVTMDVDRVTYEALPVIRYTPHTPLCRASQAGHLGVVVGDGHPFLARCDLDGEIWVWDAVH